MANANVDKKSSVEATSGEAGTVAEARGGAWQEQPSVLKPRRFKIGDGEDDPVD